MTPPDEHVRQVHTLPQIFFALIIRQLRILCCIPVVRRRRILCFSLVDVRGFFSLTLSERHVVYIKVLPQGFCDVVIRQKKRRPHARGQTAKSPVLLPRPP